MEAHLTQIRTSPHIAVATGLKAEESGGLIKGGRGREKEGRGTKCVGGMRNEMGGVEKTPPAPRCYPQWFSKTQRESREINRNLVMYAFRERDKKRMLCTLDVNKATSQIKTKVEFIKFKHNFVLDTIKVFGIFGNL